MEFEDSGARFSSDRIYRYKLWRTWDSDLKTCAFIMLNPSTADEATNDNTIKRCINYAIDWGYGTIVVGNLFALVSTNPHELWAPNRKVKDSIGPLNDQYLKEINETSDIVITAWGNNGGYMDRSKHVLGMLKNPHYLRINPFTNEPAHPLYLPKDLIPLAYGEDVL